MRHPKHAPNPTTKSESGPDDVSDLGDGLAHGSFDEHDLVELDELLVRFGNREIDLWCVEGLDGYLTAAMLAPAPVMPSTFLPPIWAKDHVWRNAEVAQRAMELVLRWYQDVVAWPDVAADDLGLEIEEGPFVYPMLDQRIRDRTRADGTVVREEVDEEIGRSWAQGFGAGLRLAADSWREALRDDEIAVLVGTIRLLDGGDPDTGKPLGNRAAMALVDDELPAIVRELRQRIRGNSATGPVGSSARERDPARPDRPRSSFSDAFEKVDVPQFDPEMIDRVDELLTRYADPGRGIANSEMLDGFLSAFAVMPDPIDPRHHADSIWGGLPAWDSESDQNDASALIESLALWIYSRTAIPLNLARQPERLIPELLVPEGDDLDAHPDFALARDWARGFGKGMALYSDDWDELLEFAPDAHTFLSPMIILDLGHNPDRPDLLIDMQRRQQLVAMLSGCLAELASRWDTYAGYLEDDEPAVPAPIRRATPKIGRNDPCPCGSGRKHKHCCGAPGRAQ
jgi:uncharacterized protein